MAPGFREGEGSPRNEAIADLRRRIQEKGRLAESAGSDAEREGSMDEIKSLKTQLEQLEKEGG